MKQFIIDLANKPLKAYPDVKGDYFDLDKLQIPSSMDGAPIAAYLTSIGFTVLSYEDTGRNGLVKTAEGVAMSTNGYTYMYK